LIDFPKAKNTKRKRNIGGARGRPKKVVKIMNDFNNKFTSF
jgi:hypothetical protein